MKVKRYINIRQSNKFLELLTYTAGDPWEVEVDNVHLITSWFRLELCSSPLMAHQSKQLDRNDSPLLARARFKRQKI